MEDSLGLTFAQTQLTSTFLNFCRAKINIGKQTWRCILQLRKARQKAESKSEVTQCHTLTKMQLLYAYI